MSTKLRVGRLQQRNETQEDAMAPYEKQYDKRETGKVGSERVLKEMIMIYDISPENICPLKNSRACCC